MKFILASFWSPGMQEIADVTWTNKVDYAKRHGYDTVHRFHPPGVDIMWDRPLQWWKTLCDAPDGTWCGFLGCDTVFTRPDIPLEKWFDDSCDAHLLVDQFMVFGDVHFWKASKKTRDFMRTIADRTDPFGGKDGNEQEAFTSALSRRPFKTYQAHTGSDYGTRAFYDHARVLLQTSGMKVELLNISNFAGDDPSNWPDGSGVVPWYHAWTPEHLILHLGGLSNATRLNALRTKYPTIHEKQEASQAL